MDKSPLRGVVLFGDSVLFGTGASHRKFGCGRILRSLIDVPVIIKGRNKETSRDGLKRIQRDALEEDKASHVIILFGNNDCKLIDYDKAIVGTKEYERNLVEMVRLAKSKNKVPIISNLQPIDSGLFRKTLPDIAKLMVEITPYEGQKKYSDICNQIAASENIALADIRSSLEDNLKETLAADGIHPNDAGHKIIAEEFLHKLKS
ncbi:MAG: hypothetical protein K9M01_02050 [Candidatus Omnitrophica bacterium]|nr:hypothetical protein [Candidatus Omnitrophota bacterium]